jgi:hypothetical protein
VHRSLQSATTEAPFSASTRETEERLLVIAYRELNRVPNYLYDRDALFDLSMQGTVNVGSSMTS